MPHARDDKVAVLVVYLGNGLAENLGVGDAVAGDKHILLVLAVGLRKVAGLDKDLAQEYHGKDYAHNAKRVCEGTAQCGSAAVDAKLLECLLCCGKCRCVGCGTAKYTGHVRYGNIRGEAQSNGKQCACKQYTNGWQQQFCSLAAH